MTKFGTRAILFWLVAAALVVALGVWALVDYLTPFGITDIQLVKTPGNRLRVMLNVTTTHGCDAYVAYWVPGKKDTLYSELSKGGRRHAIGLYNLTGPEYYSFRVVACGPGGVLRYSQVHPFSISPIYQATPYFFRDSVSPVVERKLDSTYFLTQILTQPGSAVILNSEGEIVWYEPFKKGVKVSHWTKDRTVLAIVGPASIPFSGGDEIVEIGLDGKYVRDWKVGQGEMDKQVHHEVRKDEQGNIYAMTFDRRVFDMSRVGGGKKDTITGDGVVLYDPQEHKLWEWSLFDHLSPERDSSALRRKLDWVHGNSVFRTKDGHFLVSFRDLNQVWKVAYPSGKVLWKLGEGGDYRLPPEDVFSGQHNVHLTAAGGPEELMILDNGVKKKRTRALSFVLDSAGHTAHSTIHAALDPENFNTSKGSVDWVDGHYLLFSLTDTRLFLLTDVEGHILWRIRVGGDPYRVEAISDFLTPRPTFP